MASVTLTMPLNVCFRIFMLLQFSNFRNIGKIVASLSIVADINYNDTRSADEKRKQPYVHFNLFGQPYQLFLRAQRPTPAAFRQPEPEPPKPTPAKSIVGETTSIFKEQEVCYYLIVLLQECK